MRQVLASLSATRPRLATRPAPARSPNSAMLRILAASVKTLVHTRVNSNVYFRPMAQPTSSRPATTCYAHGVQMARCSLVGVRQRMRDAAIATPLQHLRDGDVIAPRPEALEFPAEMLPGIFGGLPQCFVRIPAIHRQHQSRSRVLPGLLAEATRDRLGDLRDGLVSLVKFVVVPADELLVVAHVDRAVRVHHFAVSGRHATVRCVPAGVPVRRDVDAARQAPSDHEYAVAFLDLVTSPEPSLVG